MKPSTLFFDGTSVLLSQLALLTENSLVSCHLKEILQLIRNSDLNMVHGMI